MRTVSLEIPETKNSYTDKHATDSDGNRWVRLDLANEMLDSTRTEYEPKTFEEKVKIGIAYDTICSELEHKCYAFIAKWKEKRNAVVFPEYGLYFGMDSQILHVRYVEVYIDGNSYHCKCIDHDDDCIIDFAVGEWIYSNTDINYLFEVWHQELLAKIEEKRVLDIAYKEKELIRLQGVIDSMTKRGKIQ